MMKSDRKKFRITRALFLSICAIMIYLCVILLPYNGWIDFLITRYEARKPNPHVVLISISNEDKSKYGNWPWPREYMARMVDFLRESGAKVIVFDFFFTDRIASGNEALFRIFRSAPSGEQFLQKNGPSIAAKDCSFLGLLEFLRAIKDHGKVVMARFWDSENNTLSEIPECYAESGLRFGHVAMTTESAYRQYPLFVIDKIYNPTVNLSKNNPTLSLGTLAYSLYCDWDKPPVEKEGSAFRPSIRIGTLSIPAFPSPLDTGGIPSHMMISYTGGSRHFIKYDQDWPASLFYDIFTHPYVTGEKDTLTVSHEPAGKIIEQLKDQWTRDKIRAVQEKIRGNIVIICNRFDTHDAFSTPYSRYADDIDASQEASMFGGEIHANAISTLLDRRFIRYDLIILLVIPLFFLALGVIVFSRPIKWHIRFIVSLLLCIAWPLLSIEIFKKLHIITSLWSPIAGLMLLFLCLIFYERKQFITYFGQFVSHRLKDAALADEKAAEVGTREVEATILFADIRGFSTLSEQLTPGELTARMTEYHTEMNKIFEKNNGVILDYLGDAEMVGFGTLCEEKHHALLAIKSGLEMQQEIALLRGKWGIVGGQVIEVGVGICTGTVAEGIVGSDSKKQLISMGDTTNTAARIQALSKQLDSLVTISESTWQEVKDDIVADPLDEMPLKGKTKKVMLYRVRGIKPGSLAKLERTCRID